jgi:serine/threonine-protein kinase HipA
MTGELEFAVGLYGQDIGRLRVLASGNSELAFDPAWANDPNRPILGLHFEDQLPGPIRPSAPLHLPFWFSNLLPQGAMRRFMARLHQLSDEDHDGLFLSVAGLDLPGAVTLRPLSPRAAEPARLPAQGGSLPPRFSLAGVQWKFSLRPSDKGLLVSHDDEAGLWIAKLPDPNPRHKDLPRVEAATLAWARASGIQVPQFRLGHIDELGELPRGIPTGDGQLLLIQRFDRRHDAPPDQERVHMEDFAQVFDRPPGHNQYEGSYEEIGAVLGALDDRSATRFVRQLVFCILCGNGDAHLKNWSLLYTHPRTPTLSPAYDLVPTILYKEDDALALSLHSGRNFADLELASFRPLLELCLGEHDVELDEQDMLKPAIARVKEAWEAHKDDFGYTRDEQERLEQHMRRVPLYWDA